VEEPDLEKEDAVITTSARQLLAVHRDESLSAYGPARATVKGAPLGHDPGHEDQRGIDDCQTHQGPARRITGP
jgi:hypothetical protein